MQSTLQKKNESNQALLTAEGTMPGIMYQNDHGTIFRWIWCLSHLRKARTLHEISIVNWVFVRVSVI